MNILAIGWNDESAIIAAVVDTAGNSYEEAVPTFRGGGLSQAIYYAPEVKGGTNIVTVKFNQPASYVDLRVAEYSGLASINAFDTAASAAGLGTSAAAGPVVVADTNSLLLAAGMTATTFTAPGFGFTARTITSPDADMVEDQIATAAGSYSASASLSSGNWLMQLAVFKPAPPPVPLLRLFLTSTNTVLARWPAGVGGFRLEENPDLGTTNWQSVTNPVGVLGGENQIILYPASNQRFYRLRYP